MTTKYASGNAFWQVYQAKRRFAPWQGAGFVVTLYRNTNPTINTIIMSLPPREIETVKVAGLSELAGVAIGLGLGILIGGNFKDAVRRGAGIGLVAAGVLSSLPTVIGIVSRQLNHDGSSRSMRNKLASIREDAGLQSESELFQ